MMKFFLSLSFLVLLLPVLSSPAAAQTEESESVKFRLRDHLVLDVNGSALILANFNEIFIPYNLHVAAGVRVSGPWSVTGSWNTFGYTHDFGEGTFSGYGAGVRFDRKWLFAKVEAIHPVRFSRRDDDSGFSIRKGVGFPVVPRVHVGCRIAPRFTAGFAFARGSNIPVHGWGYVPQLDNWGDFRGLETLTSFQLFFGLSLPGYWKNR